LILVAGARARIARLERLLLKERATRRAADLDSTMSELRSLPLEFHRRAENLKAANGHELGVLQQLEAARRSDLETFKHANGLAREAQAQHHPVTNALFIATIVIAETLLNMANFADASAAGLLGGVYAAVSISLINALCAAFLTVPTLRHLNHVNAATRYWGGAVLATTLAFMLIVNLVAGHYRAAIEADPVTAARDAWASFAAGPLAIPSVQAWLLSLLGVMGFTAIAGKFYFSLDPYPQFGRMHRAWEEATADLDAARRRIV
jgi:hypothetical protein